MKESLKYLKKQREIILSDNPSFSDSQMDAEWRNIVLKSIQQKKLEKRKKLYKKTIALMLPAAAAIILLFFSIFNSKESKTPLAPGKIYAELETPSGERYSLDSLSKEALLSLGIIETAADNRISLNSEQKEEFSLAQDVIERVKINVPLYCEYRLTLEDGTSVWLNSGSSIEFSKDITNRPREVWLAGEAYFDVAKYNGKSFSVHTPDCSIIVLGTSFNVRSNQLGTQTALVSGAVNIKTESSSSMLEPGCLATVDKSGNISISPFDIESVTAWMRGEIIFKNTQLSTILEELSRWYNVEIIFENDQLKKLQFSLFLTRTVDFEDVLNNLEQTDKIRYKIVKNNIYVLTP